MSAYKSLFAVVATLLGAGLALPIRNLFKTTTAGFMGMGSTFGILIIISVLIPFFLIKEKPIINRGETKREGIVKRNLDVFKNRPFRIILTTWTLNAIGVSLVTADLVYYFKYIHNDESLLTIAIAIMILTSMLFIPVCVAISKRIGKSLTYAIGMIIFCLALAAIFFAGHLVDMTYFYIVMFIAGAGMLTHYVMPWSIIPDTVDYDEWKAGSRKEGAYYGIWTFMIKVGQALSGLFLGMILSLFGYAPDIIPSSLSKLGIRIALSPIPAVFFIIGIWFLFKYPISKEKYVSIQNTLKNRSNK